MFQNAEIIKFFNLADIGDISDIDDDEEQNKAFLEVVKEDLYNHLIKTSQVEDLVGGWMQLNLLGGDFGAHGTLLRIDQEFNKVWFFDPNSGLVAFEGDYSFEEALKLCADYISDLVELDYSDMRFLLLQGLLHNNSELV